MTIKELVERGLWEEYFVDENGVHLPKTEENINIWLEMKVSRKWILVSKEISS